MQKQQAGQNPLEILANLDLKKLPDKIIQEMVVALEAEMVRRKGQKKRANLLFKEVRLRVKGKENCTRTQEDLFHEEWDVLYPEREENPRRDFYVYAHVVPDVGLMEVKTTPDAWSGIRIRGIPFYIGKGCGGRAFDLNRSQGHGKEIQELLRSGVGPSEIVCILSSELTEQEAFKLESKLIYFFGTRYEKEVNGMLVNLDIPVRPAHLDKPRHKEPIRPLQQCQLATG